MADSSGSIGYPDYIQTAAAQKEATANALIDAASPSMLYGRRDSTTSGLTWGYYGGRYDSIDIANGTLLLTASQTNYIVANRTTGAVSTSTSITNWNDTINYLRLLIVTTGGSTITDIDDYRQAIGLIGTGGGGSSLTQENVEDIIGTLITAGSNVTVNYNDGASPATLEIAATTSGLNEEQVQDAVGALLTAGSNITLNYNDGDSPPTLSISATGSGGFTEEQVQDIIGSLLTAGSGISLNYNDGDSPATLSITATGGGPGGSNTQVQFNDSSAFGGDAGLVYNKTTDVLTGVNATLTGIFNTAKGSDIARAGTTDIWAATGNFVHLTGTTTITSFGTNTAGQWRLVRFAGAGTLTHNATSLILPGAASITTAANDTALVVGEGTTNARVLFYNRASGLAIVSSSITGWTNSLNVASPNNIVNASRWLASGGTTDQDAVFQAKGVGSILAQLPDSTTAGGDKRGTNSVDLQSARAAAADVASGSYSFIGAGADNRVTSTAGGVVAGSGNQCTHNYTFVGSGQLNVASQNNAGILCGVSNAASGSYSGILGGDTNTSSGTYSSVLGGRLNVANSIYGMASGNYASTKGIDGAYARAAGQFSGTGDAQKLEVVLRAATSDATPTVLTSDAAAASTNNQMILQDDSAALLKVRVVARSSANRAAYQTDVLIYRDTGVGSTTIQGSPTVTTLFNSAGASTWVVAVSADTTNGGLSVTVTGVAATNIRWVCDIERVEVAA